jgi:hypothetical protein
VYRLEPTTEYLEELRAIEAGTGQLAPRLNQGAYRVLERDPTQGAYSTRHDFWRIRQQVLPGLLLVSIVYTIDEERKVVRLISISSVDLTRM